MIFIADNRYFMNQFKKPSQRQLLIARAKRFQISSRIKNNLQEIEQKTERMSQSRSSSISSKSRKTNRSHLSMEVRQMSPKIKLLENIIEKLKKPKPPLDRKSEISTQDHRLRQDHFQLAAKFTSIIQKEQKRVEKMPEKLKQSSPSRHKSKLEAMLKDIKKCNQQSTKAVSSVKKGFMKTKQETLPFHQPVTNKQPSILKQQLNQTFKEIADLKQELRKTKQQNKLLLQIVKINQTNESLNQKDRSRTKKCQVCGCQCKEKSISSLKTKQAFEKTGIN